MFIQLMQGKTSDAAALRRQFERWITDLRSGAAGFLGSTGGVAEDGTAFIAARFESEEAAQANSDRPEQGEWWAETEKLFDGPVSFTNSTDVQVQLEPPAKAGFVQVIQSKVKDRKRLEELNQRFEAEMANARPDVVGMVTVWDGDLARDIVYFSSEGEAREGETQELPAEFDELMSEYNSLAEDMKYLDLKDPWID